MTPILFYGVEITAEIVDDNVVVHCSGESTVPLTFSKEREMGTDKYIDKREIVICTDIMRLRIMNDFNKMCAVVAIELNV